MNYQLFPIVYHNIHNKGVICATKNAILRAMSEVILN